MSDPIPSDPPREASRTPQVLIAVGMFVFGGVQMYRAFSHPSLPSAHDAEKAASLSLSSMKSFQSSGVRLKYPSDWIQAPEADVIFGAKAYKGVVNVNLRTEDVTAGTTIEAYADATVANVLKAAAELHPVKLTQDYVTVHGLRVAKLTFSIDIKDVKGQNELVLFVKGDKAYDLTGTSTAEVFPAYKPVFDAIAESIELPN